MNTGRNTLAGAGTQGAAVGFGGRNPGVSALTEEYNGSAWATSNNLNTARMGLAGSGTQTAAIAFGGGPSPAANIATELYDGSSWTNTTSMTTGKQQGAGGTASTNSSSIAFGGGGNVTATEEFTGIINEVTSLDVS